MHKLKSTKPGLEIDTDWIEKGRKCWVFNPMDDLIIFMKAKVLQFKPSTYVPSASTVLCQFEGSNKLEIPVIEVFQRNQFTSILTNLTDLEVINNPQILFQLNQRFKQKKIFTFIGSNLLIINPYQMIPHVFDQNMIDYYYDAIFVQKMTYKDQEPHIYGMTSEILKNISLENEDQVIIISGESGSGKTETNKFCLKYLTKVCHKFVQSKEEQVLDIENKILNCNPLLEAFGNAKTIKNDNSSRFGKLTALKIHSKHFYIKQAFIRSYFLQKSRVTLKNANQLNFHILYYVIDGIPVQDRAKYHLLNIDSSVMTINHFNYTKTKQTLDQYKHLKCFNEVVSSMRILGLNGSIEEIWRLVMGILHLGNLAFDQSTFSQQKNGSPCTVADPVNLKSISDLLGVVPSDLQKSIVFYKRKTPQEQFFSVQNRKKCEETRDSISKMIYESLFLWLIDKLNKTLSPMKSQQQPNFYYLKLLDIYGFEVFEQNGYEQLAVNYTNQRLHQIYIRQVFKQQKQAFREQGIGDAIINLKFADNTGVIQLIDLSPTSIYNLVDQSCTIETKDDSLLSNIKKVHLQKSPEYFPPDANKNLIRKSFIINHTPGQIEYNIVGFRQKNKDFVREDIIELLSYSTNSILNEMFKEQQKSLLENKTKRFLSQKLRQEINSLMGELEAGTHVHFVRCIKPNDYKQPFVFVPKMALNQIKYLGLLDTILLRRATYHIKMPYQNFYKLYSSIDFNYLNSDLSYRQKAQQLFKKHFMGRGVDYIFGSSKIFLKQDSKPMIDKLYNQKLKRITEYSHLLESYIYSSRQVPIYQAKKQRYDKMIVLEVYISNFVFEAKRNQAARRLQRWWSITINQHVNKRKRKNCITVQKYWRKFLYSLNYNATMNHISILEKYFHSHARSSLHQERAQFKRQVMDQILDQIWSKAIELKINTINKYFCGMINRIDQKSQMDLINKNYRQRMNKRVTKNISVYLQSILPSSKYQNYIKSIVYIQRTFRFLKIRNAFIAARASAKIIQRSWRKYHSQKLQNIKFYQKVFEKENKNKNQFMKVANEVLYKSKKLKNNTIQHLLGELQNTKSNKIYLFYYLIDYQILVDISLVYSQNSWINNYYTLFKDSIQKSNPIQMISLGQTHTLVSSTNKIYSWGWNDYNQLGISDKSIPASVINSINLPVTAKPKSIRAFNNYSSISFNDPPCIHYFGRIEQDKQILNIEFYSTINKKYTILNGQTYQIINKMYKQIPMHQKISNISCGALHVVAKSHLKHIFSWGNNDKGQLGHGDYINKDTPTPILFQIDIKQNKPIQISAGHSSTLILLNNHKIYWCGSTSKITKVNIPIQLQLDKQSSYIWDYTKYIPVRISSSWSRIMSIHGVTFAFHHGVLSTNISLKKKVITMLTNKWSEMDSNNLLPPYVPSIARYFTEKTMRMPNYKPETEMESRKKLKQLRQAIEVEINSYKITNSQYASSEAYEQRQFEFD